MLSSGDNIGQVDLDSLINDLNIWQTATSMVRNENGHLKEEVKEMSRQLKEAKHKESLAKNEVIQHEGIVRDIQSILQQRCNMEDENRELKEQLKELESKRRDDILSHEKELTVLKKKMDELGDDHTLELASIADSWKQTCDNEADKYKAIIAQKCEEIEEKVKQINELEVQKQEEIQRLHQEYSEKLLRLQKQTAKLQQAGQGTGSNNDIFRKKLQHQKAESDQQIKELKKTIQDLETKLSNQQSGQGYQPFAKKRRYHQ